MTSLISSTGAFPAAARMVGMWGYAFLLAAGQTQAHQHPPEHTFDLLVVEEVCVCCIGHNYFEDILPVAVVLDKPTPRRQLLGPRLLVRLQSVCTTGSQSETGRLGTECDCIPHRSTTGKMSAFMFLCIRARRSPRPYTYVKKGGNW